MDSGNSSTGNCAVMRNPFSTAVASPRIPDGRATLSAAQRYSTSKSVMTSSGTMYALIYPGFFSGLTVATGIAVGNGTPVQDRETGLFNSAYNRKVTLQNALGQTASEVNLQTDAMCPNRWRVVSQGCRFTLINNTLDNDGWWEAIRVNHSASPDDVLMYAPTLAADATAVPAGSPIVLVPEIGAWENGLMLSATDWSADPSYMAGKLRDIHKFTFNNHRIGDPDFVTVVEEPVVVKGASAAASDLNKTRLKRHANDQAFWVDKGMDCIALRFKANAGASSQLQVHCHMIQHVEEMYDPASPIHRFCTIPPRNLRLTEATLAAIKSNIKAGMLRGQTTPVAVTRKRRSRKRRRYV